MASSTNTIISTVEGWYAKLPSLPKDARELLVKITPWVALIFGVLGTIAGVAGLGILTALGPFMAVAGAFNAAGSGLLSAVILLASSVLLLAAFPGLRKGKVGGWNLLFWSEAVSVVGGAVAVSLSGILFSLIGLYLVFQIKSYYK